MAFHELGFLFIFFPVAMALYFLVPKIGKNALLVLLSLVFFAWGSMEFVVLLLLLIVFNFFTGLQLDALKDREKARKLVLWSAVAVDVLLLGFFKYRGFLADNINALLKTNLAVGNTAMPLGVSFFTFSILSFLFDVYREKTPAPKNILDFALFVSFFPKLVSGPIVSYHDFTSSCRTGK
jgi:alginate O-acetyltransferase complex protein AlgI